MGGTLSSFKYRASFPVRYPTIQKPQARCIRYRLNKKLKKVNRDAAASEFRDAAAAGLPRLSKERSAGSGNFVPFLGSSNPRVLSDMGLAIPRPTRLGDPRSEPESNSVSVCASLSNIILTSLRCCPFLRAALQLFAAVLLLAAMVPTI
jgi:hypothetical protein